MKVITLNYVGCVSLSCIDSFHIVHTATILKNFILEFPKNMSKLH